MSSQRLIPRVAALLFATICTLPAGVPPAAADAAPLPMLGVDGSRVSVSGVSSGAYMAVQFHVAFSEEVMGAGVVAGGPYGCAQGLATYALQRCMDTTLGRPDGAQLFREARRLARQGHIDATENLADDRVYIFAGRRDGVVDPRVVAETADFYRAAGLAAEHITYVDDIGAGHGFVTTDHGLACAATGAPFINDCDYDQAGAILEAIYRDLQAPSAGLSGRILAFDQGAFISRPHQHSMGDTGYVYIPAACEQPGAACRLHVAFHGCKQSTADIGDLFYTSAGYNPWADANRIVVLYPQALAGPGNPNGCWDWWGYDDDAYHTRAGPQMAAVAAMVERLAADPQSPAAPPFCRVHAGSNYSHWAAGRAHVCSVWFICANGSDEHLGWIYGRTTLFEHPEGHFSTTACP